MDGTTHLIKQVHKDREVTSGCEGTGRPSGGADSQVIRLAQNWEQFWTAVTSSQAEGQEDRQVLTTSTSWNRLKKRELETIVFISFCRISSTVGGWQVRGGSLPLRSGLPSETPLLSLLLCPPPDCNWSFSQLHKISILPAIWMPADKIERCVEDKFGIWRLTGRGDSNQQAHTDLHLLMFVQLVSPHLLPVELLLLLLLQHVFTNQPVSLDFLQVFPLLEFLYIWILEDRKILLGSAHLQYKPMCMWT